MSWFVIGGMLVCVVKYEGGGYISLDQVLLRLTGVYNGVGGAVVANKWGTCRELPRCCI